MHPFKSIAYVSPTAGTRLVVLGAVHGDETCGTRAIERVVAEHPSVAQVAVVGTPDEKWGEAVTAVVVLREGADASDEGVARMTEEIKAAVKERKGAVQAPKQVVVADSIPMTGLGKPDKKTLRAQFWGDRQRSVG